MLSFKIGIPEPRSAAAASPASPPPDEAFGTYQRFKNVFCNANRPYQPELVFDVKLLTPVP